TDEETDGEVQREVAALREWSGAESVDRRMLDLHRRHARRGALPLVALVERFDDRLPILREPPNDEDDAGDDRDERREDETDAADVVHEPRKISSENVSKNAKR